MVALVKAALGLGKVVKIPPTEATKSLPQTWALLHVQDSATAYITLLDAVLEGKSVGPGVYFAVNGDFAWDDMSRGVARSLGMDDSLPEATPQELEKIAEDAKTHDFHLHARQTNIQDAVISAFEASGLNRSALAATNNN